MRFYYMRRILFFVMSYGMRVMVFIACICCFQTMTAQNDGNVSMYWAVPGQFNPATVGSDSAMNVSAFDRMQWVGVEGAPQTFFAAVDMPFKLMKKRMGAGLNVLNDKAGLFSTTIIGAQYSYSQKLLDGRLALGAQLGMVNQAFKGTDIYIPDGDAWEPSDDYLPRTDVSGMSVDFGFGAYYQRSFGKRDFYAGLSMMHLNEAEIDLDEYAYSQQKRTYYFLAGGNIPVSRTLFIVHPSVLVKTIGQATVVDVTMRASYDHRFWGGLSYRHGDAVVMMLGADIQSIRLGYSYDIGTSALARVSSGSHELMVTYKLKIDLDKNKKHPHKSIRIL